MPDKRGLVTSNICFGSKIPGLLESFLSSLETFKTSLNLVVIMCRL